MDRTVIEAVIVNAAFFQRSKDPFLLHAHSGIQNTNFQSSLHNDLRGGGITPPLQIYSPQSSCSMGASCTVAGSIAVTSRSTPQSEQTMISPTSVPSVNSIWASHSGQVTADMILLSFDLFNLIFDRLEACAANRIPFFNGLDRVEDLIHIRFKRGT